MYYASVSIYQEFIKFLAHTSNMSISCQTITAARAYTQNHSTPAHATEKNCNGCCSSGSTVKRIDCE